MICPFRVGLKYEYQYIGKNTAEDRANSEKYIEVAQHAFFEECDKEDCPFYNYAGSCDRIGDK